MFFLEKIMMKLYHLLRNAVLTLFAKRTVGVRALLIHQDKILLVKHTYQTGWYTIGGGVDPGETPREAMERELMEEVGVRLTSSLQLFSVYHSRHEKRDDYIIVYVGHGHTQEPVISPEIAQQQWFPLSQLPKDISPATQRRIQEYLGKVEVSERW
ncbi:ADP-ribose pyrophosphatase [Legionella oakridgensis RV-2-2007]|nr:ADP-ribose pyrophosphatase [Legionella oakridgensis RV-2-2007]